MATANDQWFMSRTFLRKVLPLPTDKNKLCANGYLAGLAPFFGPVIGLEDALAIYRLHDTSYWSLHGLGFEQECQRRLGRLITEFHQVNDVLNRHFSTPPTMSLEDNLRYQQWRFGAGESHSRLKVIKAVICTHLADFNEVAGDLLPDALAYAGMVIYFSLVQLDFRGPAALLDRQSKGFGDR